MVESIYAESIENAIPSWYLVTSLLSNDPSLCTIYVATDVQQHMAELKGARHPAHAAGDTIRGSFWCDNTVCNLVHMSDNPDAVERELGILITGLETRSISSVKNLIAPSLDPWKHVKHSGVLALYQLIRRGMEAAGQPPVGELVIPTSGSSKATFRTVKQELMRLASTSPRVESIVKSYLSGHGAQAIDELERFCPPTSWEKFVIKCGATSMDSWAKVPLEEVVAELARFLATNNVREWVVGASAAMGIYGLKVSPNDVDVRCSERALHTLSDVLRKPIVRADYGEYAANVLAMTLLGWDVEFVGDLAFKRGVRAAVDELMLTKDRPNHALQSVEDLIAEFLIMNRDAPKHDLFKARQLLRAFGSRLDLDYLRERMERWCMEMDVIEFLRGRDYSGFQGPLPN